MALYTIGEVALLCDINPVTLRAWQRRYGLLKPQRTDGGHRLFNDADIDRIREIKRWIDNGVRVSKVKVLLSSDSSEQPNGWREQQEILLHYLQSSNLHSLRLWVKERGQDYPAQTLTTNLFVPLRRRLQCQQPALQALLGILDGILINYIALCPASARKKQGKDALVIGWNIHDTTRLWLEGWVASQQGWRIDVLAHSLSQFRPELLTARRYWYGAEKTRRWRSSSNSSAWRAQGHDIHPLGV